MSVDKNNVIAYIFDVIRFFKRQFKLFLFFIMVVAITNTVQAGPENIANKAKATASASLNSRFDISQVKDGVARYANLGEWASDSKMNFWGGVNYPWMQLDWDSPQTINKVVFYDRTTLLSHTAGGTLYFSDGSQISVTAIPNDGSPKTVVFPDKKVEWIKFEVTDGNGDYLGLSEIEVFPAPADYEDYVSWVDPYIETTRGRYFYFVTGSRPFGMISAAPMTRNKNQMGGGYNYNTTEILGFPQVHGWMLSGLDLMPTTGDVDPSLGEQNWKSRFSHGDEIVQPGYHKVFLEDYNIWVEQTTTDRVSLYRFKYAKDAVSNILINLGGYIGTSTMTDAKVTKISDTEIHGSVNTMGRLWGGPDNVTLFFVIQFDKPFEKMNGWADKNKYEHIEDLVGSSEKTPRRPEGWTYYDAPTSGISALYNVKEGSELKVKMAISYTSIENARNNLEQECNHWNFDQVRKEAKAEWNDWLGKIDVKGGSDAFWLTQWNLNILWGLAWPEVLDDFSASLVQYADNGKLLPRGPNVGGYSYIMTGCPATPLIVSAYTRGLLTKVDHKHAYKVMKQNHMPGGMLEADDDYIEKGYFVNNAGKTLEAAFQDWSLAQMALGLRKEKDAAYFLKRSQGWKTLFNEQYQLIFPKDKKGDWLHTNPLSGQGWIEANAWQATWSVSHDIKGLAKLMGGNDALCNKLNYAFEQADTTDFVFAYGNGYVSYANQPGCSNAHVFNYAGKPWLTQYWVRQVNEQAYGGITPDKGYGGHDEDQGQMGGVSALMSLGLFSLKGNTSLHPVYEITSPVFDEITIKLNPDYYQGNEFVIKTHHNSKENMYIQKAILNGKPLNKYWFEHAEFSKGGVLQLWMDSKPNKNWGE
ncbi:GH92 family glycosyl hydrolase [Snuella sedimenti]|uniref:Glycoside hydrolase family 92 protein n=1 Tax=Snuella sedimenti TaxID=2798802 RepID=A0A8J7LRQ5_9FLAO|nr:GH92 family glycosyl hydrolase [Snuella sedimenti]MBJ6367455.1 glycoside hydrolase family 92 protein [Snuella sedimenti]